jgi:dihydrolipoamide dehydrogenase
VIGLELGSVWRRLGAKVTVLEALPNFLAAADAAVAKEAWKIFVKEQGLDIKLGVNIGKVSRGKRGVTLEYESSEGKQALDCNKLVVSVGRVPARAGLARRRCGLKIGRGSRGG